MALGSELPHDGQGSATDAARISTICVRGLVEAVEAAGVSAQEFLHQASISPQLLATPYGWVSPSEFDRLTSHAIELTRDPAFGLHWAERSPMMKFELLPMLTAHAPTVREALACVVRFQTILWKPVETELVERTDAVLLRFVPCAMTELGARVLAELAIAGLARLLRYVGAPQSAVRGVTFTHRAPSYAHEYVRVFGSRVRFDRSYSAIEISSKWADLRLQDVNTELHQVLTLQAQQVLERVERSGGYAGRVREYVRSVFPRQPEMAEVAHAMATSVRSLRRRLADEGSSYSAILQDSQQLLARRLLVDPTRSIKQVGHDLGFTSATGFCRAFKRWTGESPAAFRSTSQRVGQSTQ